MRVIIRRWLLALKMVAPKILVIEDEGPILENLIELLSIEGYEVRGGCNGREGVAIASDWLPDLIISDASMREMDGYEFLGALRAEPKTASIPFLFLSAKAGKKDVQKGIDLGVRYITKPFARQELLDEIALCLNL